MAKAKTKSKRKPLPKKATDPIYAAIAERRKREKIWGDLSSRLEVAVNKANKKHGHRPWSLIRWRKYGAIGGDEIDRARREFLDEGSNPKMINEEYRDAKARERAGERAEKAWDRRVGIAAQRRECDRAIAADNVVTKQMAKTRPTTPAGAAAMLAYLKKDAESGEMSWHETAFDTLIATLNVWGKAAQS